MKKYQIKNLFRDKTLLLYIAMSMLGKEKKSCLPELFYTLDVEDVYKLITIVGGQQIYIPNPKELSFYLNCSIALYYLKCQNKQWGTIQKYLGVSEKEIKKIKIKVKEWIKLSSKDEIQMLEKLKEPSGKLEL